MSDEKGFLTDGDSKPSMMRAMSASALIGSFAFGLLALKMDSENGVYLCAMYLIAAFAPKALQSFAENKLSK